MSQLMITIVLMVTLATVLYVSVLRSSSVCSDTFFAVSLADWTACSTDLDCAALL